MKWSVTDYSSIMCLFLVTRPCTYKPAGFGVDYRYLYIYSGAASILTTGKGNQNTNVLNNDSLVVVYVWFIKTSNSKDTSYYHDRTI